MIGIKIFIYNSRSSSYAIPFDDRFLLTCTCLPFHCQTFELIVVTFILSLLPSYGCVNQVYV